MKNIAYCRTSTMKQEKGLESQKRAIENYCELHNVKMSTENYILEEGISGTKRKRPQLDKVIKLVKSGQVNSVIVYSFSRMARSTSHLLDLLELFKKHNVEFISITEKIETGTAMGQAIYTILAAVCQLERDLISSRVKSGLENARAKGKKIGRPRTRDSKKIRELHKLGLSQREIARQAGCSKAAVWRELSD